MKLKFWYEHLGENKISIHIQTPDDRIHPMFTSDVDTCRAEIAEMKSSMSNAIANLQAGIEWLKEKPASLTTPPIPVKNPVKLKTVSSVTANSSKSKKNQKSAGSPMWQALAGMPTAKSKKTPKRKSMYPWMEG
jgi:hypothetical protein